MNRKVARVADLVTGNPITEDMSPLTSGKEKNPAAVALGKLGGLKGGNARALKLSATKRSQIARKAALKRWESK